MSDNQASAPAASSVAGDRIPSIPGLIDLWTKVKGDPRVAIALLDGPVDWTHPALVGADLATVESVAPAIPRSDGPATRHGTLTASLIFGQHEPASPVAGIAPRCRGLIVPIFTELAASRALDPESDRLFLPACSQLDLARAILLAAEQGAWVINVSGGQYAPSGAAHPILADAVGRCTRRGILIVAAAGNDGCECLHVPAALPGVLAVGAMDARGEPLEASNWGQSYRTGGLLAPGTRLLGARAGGGTSVVSGTSFAAAVVSGVAGLLLSLALRHGRRLDGARIREILLDSAGKCFDDSLSCRRQLAGRLDLFRASSLLWNVDLHMSDESSLRTPSSEVLQPTGALTAEPSADSGRPSGASRSSPVAVAPVHAPAPTVVPSEGCGCAACRSKSPDGKGGLVFALGQLGYDLVSEARRDSIQQHMDGANANPFDPAQMLDYLKAHDWEAASILWTLNVDQTPIYALVPVSPFAGQAYHRLREFLTDQVAGSVERISIPGRLAGQVKLFNGQVVPVLVPELRGMFSWTTDALVKVVVGAAPPAAAPAAQIAEHTERVRTVRGFLERIYHELRSLGVTAEERAINYAATNAFQIRTVYESAVKESMELDSIEVERSAICRPDSDCWDVKLYFFYPGRQVQTVRKVHSFTIDVSDIVPVTVGSVRSWFVR